jgi:hypothetical protein
MTQQPLAMPPQNKPKHYMTPRAALSEWRGDQVRDHWATASAQGKLPFWKGSTYLLT